MACSRCRPSYDPVLFEHGPGFMGVPHLVGADSEGACRLDVPSAIVKEDDLRRSEPQAVQSAPERFVRGLQESDFVRQVPNREAAAESNLLDLCPMDGAGVAERGHAIAGWDRVQELEGARLNESRPRGELLQEQVWR